MRKNVCIRPAATQKRYKYEYNERVHETPVFKTNDLAFVGRPPLAVNTSGSTTIDEPPFNRLMPRADGPYRIMSVQQRSLNT